VFLPYPSNSTKKAYKVRGFPTFVFINSEGYLMATHIGEINEIQLDENLRKIGAIE